MRPAPSGPWASAWAAVALDAWAEPGRPWTKTRRLRIPILSRTSRKYLRLKLRLSCGSQVLIELCNPSYPSNQHGTHQKVRVTGTSSSWIFRVGSVFVERVTLSASNSCPSPQHGCGRWHHLQGWPWHRAVAGAPSPGDF